MLYGGDYLRINVNPLINEKLVLTYNEGFFRRKKLILRVIGRVDDMVNAYNRAQKQLQDAENMVRKDATELNQQKYGEAVLALFNVCFGAEGTEKIVDFFEGRYIEMLAELYPFIEEKILPKLNNPYKEAVERAKRMRK